jgi:hypothetical protein
MYRLPVAALTAALGLVACGSSAARAQYVTYYAPAPRVVTYYAPATYAPAPVIAAAPAPTPYYVGSPVVVEPAVVAAPAPVVTYYRAPAVAYQPVAHVHTRYRPILGGTVSRVRYSYMPVVY